MKKKNLLASLLITSMVLPTYPVFATEPMDEVIKDQVNFEDDLKTELENSNFGDEENIKTTYFHVLYQEDGLTIGTRSAPSIQENIGGQLGSENNLWFYGDLVESCPEGYNLVENEVELKKKEFQPVAGNEEVEKALWESLNRENRMPGESFYLKVSVKKQDFETKIQFFDPTLPIQFLVRTQEGLPLDVKFDSISDLENDPKTSIAQQINESFGINFQFDLDKDLNLLDLLVESKIGETVVGYKLKGQYLNWDGTISSFISKEKVENLNTEIPVRVQVLTVNVDKDENILGNILTPAYFSNTFEFGLFESLLEPNLTIQKVNESLARESTDLKINQKITIDDLVLVTEPANPAFNQEASQYYEVRVKASEGTIFHPSGNLTDYNCDYYSIGFETLDGQYRSFSSYIYVITQEYEDGFQQVYKQYEGKTTLIKNGLEGSIGLDLLMENLPAGYSFVESLNELQAKSFDDFIQATQEGEVPCLRDGQITDKDYPHIKKGYYYVTIPIKKIESVGTPVQSLQELEENVPILFKCASDFNIELNIYYSRLPLGTKSDLEDFGNIATTNTPLDNLTQLERLKRALLLTIRQKTHYTTQPLLTPTTFDGFVQDLVPVYCGPNNEDILYYETNSILVLRDERMDPYRKNLTVQDETQAEELTKFLTDSTGTFMGTVSDDKKESFKEWLTTSHEFDFENPEYKYSLDLDNTLISIDEKGINISFDLLAKLRRESKIKLIFSGLRKYLEELLQLLQEPNTREVALLVDQLNLEQPEAQIIPLTLYSEEESEFGVEKLEEEISLELTVEELFTGNIFDVNKATKALKEKIATEYQNYSEVLEEADLSSHVENIQQKDLMNNSFPVQEDQMVEITIEKKENSTPDDSSSNDSSISKPSGGSGGSKPSTPAEPEETKPSTSGTVGKKSLYRFYNKLTGEHFFTSDEKERDTLLKDEAWSNEGHGWITPEFSNYPIYRLCNPNNGDHHYTMDKNEYDTLQNTYGWIGEGIGLYSAGKEDESIVLLHRLYNPNATGAGSHHYTADENERNELVKLGWSYEGTAWYGLMNSES